MIFRGIHNVNMDTKGRFAMPVRYRDAFASENDSQMIVTIDIQSPCLLIYPLDTWLDIEAKLQALPGLNASSRRLQRLMLGYASEIDLDNNGRILLPLALRDYGHFEKKLMLVGQGSKFEVWSELLWHNETQKAIEDAHNGDLSIPDDLQQIVL